MILNIKKAIKVSILLSVCGSINMAYADNKETYQADSVFTSPGIVIPNKSTGTPPPPATFPTQDVSSKPITTSYSCEAYRGQYDIDSQAIGIFKITREGNSLNKYYGQIIGTDNSGCYQACTPKTTTDLQSCESVNGAGWTGNYTTTTPFTCSDGGYLQQGTKSTSNNCAAPVLPPTTPVTPTKTVCTYIKPMSSGSLYFCKNPDGTSYYTEEPPDNEPEPICPLVSGLEAKQGSIDTACNIWGSAGVYPQGQSYICTYNGWAIKNVGNSQYMNYCE